ncbi:hypothetical protein AYL99_11985 [Fonsecaea erecta]|uniref:Uncharacterized protein n=1 Tax=Fonsecaea erecta TaxID=1367422 RepID=A0A178Z1Y1_9EURO|nr:hypothetical protein AYL99_11985 [Fonsecaea erecta]OAP53799.1 hypothetical protein AYL99_11985 [Fonsecaea erecta]
MSSASTPERTPVAELLLVSPIAVGGLSVSPTKRQITPTAEATSPKKLAVITSHGAVSPFVNSIARSTFPNPFGWPVQAELAHIDERLCLYNHIEDPLEMNTPEQVLQQSPPLAHHLIFPFDLRNDEGSWADPDKEPLLRSVFPGTTGIGSNGWFILLLLRSLPPKPWPLTIAGLPLYFHTHDTFGQSPLPNGKRVTRKNGSVAEDQDYRNIKDWEPLFHVIRKFFEDIGIPITEVMYLVPWLVGRVACVYLYEDEMGRPSNLYTRRQLDPTPESPDMSKYDTLQPGLRVVSNSPPQLGDPDTYLETTTGVLLRDSVGNEFMTVAAHGFPSEAGTVVIHASPSGRVIGELISEVSPTDIALVKLAKTEKFSNVTFPNARVPVLIQLKRLGRAKCFSEIYLDSPDTGLIDGIFMLQSRTRVPNDDHEPKPEWLFTSWTYMGVDAAANLPGGMCGSAMWDAEGNVLGFFKYAPVEGVMTDWCAGVAADELINRGYTLVDTDAR